MKMPLIRSGGSLQGRRLNFNDEDENIHRDGSGSGGGCVRKSLKFTLAAALCLGAGMMFQRDASFVDRLRSSATTSDSSVGISPGKRTVRTGMIAPARVENLPDETTVEASNVVVVATTRQNDEIDAEDREQAADAAVAVAESETTTSHEEEEEEGDDEPVTTSGEGSNNPHNDRPGPSEQPEPTPKRDAAPVETVAAPNEIPPTAVVKPPAEQQQQLPQKQQRQPVEEEQETAPQNPPPAKQQKEQAAPAPAIEKADVEEETVVVVDAPKPKLDDEQQRPQQQPQQQPQQPVKQIVLLGERHSGTNWITDHLRDCFEGDVKVTNHYGRYKHWFQEPDLPSSPSPNSAVVVAMFRDPYDWVEAMRVEPHHAHDHVDWPEPGIIDLDRGWIKQGAKPLGWREFVTKPWRTARGPADRKLRDEGRTVNATCLEGYTYEDIVPCSPSDSDVVEGLAGNKYELMPDGSERAYSSVVELRAAKVRNHLSVADLPGTRALLPYRFEELNVEGTARLLREVEEATGFEARCEATLGRAPRGRKLRGYDDGDGGGGGGSGGRELAHKKIVTHRELPNDYVQWMNRYVDWEVEAKIGYERRGGSSMPTTQSAVGAVAAADTPKAEPTEPADRIILLGERHGGTNWITDHLTDCFGADIQVSNDYARFKHWFQEEDLERVPENSAVVVAMFRDPYDWVEAMRVEPHHAHDHVVWPSSTTDYDDDLGWRGNGGKPMSWKDFVTTPWTGRRGATDRVIAAANERRNALCMDRYAFADAVPCSEEDSPSLNGLGRYRYELRRDGSERAYSSIVDLRRDKVLNHLSVAEFRGTRSFLPHRFEDLNERGTAGLLREVEEATGLEARCDAVMGKARRLAVKAVVKHRELPADYIDWMNRYVDWEVESQIGYSRRE